MPDAGAAEPLTAAQLETYRDAGWVLARHFFSRGEVTPNWSIGKFSNPTFSAGEVSCTRKSPLAGSRN